MTSLATGALLAVLLALPGQAGRGPDDVLQRKDGGLLVGRVTKIDADSVTILVNGEREARRVFVHELMPYSVYKVRLDRVEKAAKGRQGFQVVLVQSESVRATRLAYPAYFADTANFAEALRAAILGD